ncbi:MAG: hypothetical protein NZZ41_00380 [Candidatus Dojkabacteria bacterium]|nr:hypothetical protein [Candidatus Dojkabacteria bacterium]
MATTPNFASSPRASFAVINTANTNRDGTGTIVTVFNAGPQGSRIETIEVIAIGATTNNVVRIFLNDGTNTRLYDEILISASTPSTTEKVQRHSLVFTYNFVLPPGWSIRASTNNAESYVVLVTGGDF